MTCAELLALRLQVIISISVVMVLTSVFSFCLKTMPQFRYPLLKVNQAYYEDVVEQRSVVLNITERKL